MTEGLLEQKACPACGVAVQSSYGFVSWCQECEWNVDPAPAPTLNWRDRRAARASANTSRKLFERLSASGMSGPPPRLAVITFAAVLVHLLTVITFAAGLALLVDGFGMALPFRILFGGFVLVVAAMVQPFLYRRKWKSKPLVRADEPQLFELIDEIAAALGCKGMDGVLISTMFNASVQRTRRHGWVMTLGVPLWWTLSPQQRVALIGHELGHQLNHDQRNGMIVHGAAISMARWAYLLMPTESHVRYRGLSAIGELFAIVVLLPLALSAAALHWLLSVLASRQGLSAEYYADALAADVAGTDAAVGMLERLMLAEACGRHVIHTAKFNKSVDPWTDVAAYADAIPAHELERQRRLGRLRLPAIDSTHPPTQLRADLIRNIAERSPRVVLDAGRAAAIDKELSRPFAAATKRLRDRYPR